MSGSRPERATEPSERNRNKSAAPAGSRAAQETPCLPDHELVRCIGRGSYGEVWLARDALGAWRAIKLIYRRHFEHDRPFEREFEGIRRFDPVSREHPSQLHVLHVGRNDAQGYFYYVMELADPAETSEEEDGAVRHNRDGSQLPLNPENYVPRTLKLELDRRNRLPFNECLRIAVSLTTALEHLHRHGLAHRDVKPSNIIFVKGVPKLADIGLVASMDATISFVGTSGFLPPEGPGTPQADLFSLGKVIYEMCMGRDRQDFPKLPADLEQFEDRERLLELNAVILKACQSEPRLRYQSAGAMAADLLLLQRGHSVRRLRAVERRLAFLTKAGVAICAMLLIASGLYWNTARQGRATARQLYVADMNRALQAWEDGNVRLARELLETHRARQPEMLGFEWCLLARLCEQSDARFTLRGHQGTVWSAAFSPDGRTLATGSGDDAVKLWDTTSGQLTHTLAGHAGAVHAVAFSPDGTLLASASRDRIIKLWQVGSWSEAAALTGHTDTVRAAAFSPDGRRMASGGEDRTIRWWDIGSRKEAGCAEAGFSVEQVAFSPDGRLLAVCGSDIKVHIWNCETRRKERELPLHQANVLSVAWSADGRTLASGSYDGTIRLWHMPTSTDLAVLGRGAPVRCVAFDPNNTFLASASEDGLVRLWDVDRHEVLTTLRGHSANVRALTFSPRSGMLASGDEASVAKLWEVSTSPGRENALLHVGIVNGLAFSPDGQRLASIDATIDTLRLWDAGSHQQLAATRTGMHAAWCVAFAEDGQVVVTGGVDASVRIWNATNLSEIVVLRGHEAAVDSVAFSPDSRLIASGSRDFSARLWDRASGRELAAFRASAAPIRAVSFAPNGNYLATASTDGRICLWGSRSLRQEALLAAAGSEVRAIAFSPDGQMLAAGGADRIIRLWDLRRKRIAATMAGHSAIISSLAFSADGRTLVSGSWDSTLRLWNVRLRREVGTLKAHSGQVTQVRFARDGSVLASASSDGTVRLWRATNSFADEERKHPQPARKPTY